MNKYDFEINTEYGLYKDSVTFPEGYTPTEQELETIKQQRVTSWLNVIKNPPQFIQTEITAIPVDASGMPILPGTSRE